jgi:uncharacterized protein
VTTLNLRSVRLRPGERYETRLGIELEPLELAGQRYEPVPDAPEAALTINRLATGTLFELRLDAGVEGPCYRCLEHAAVPIHVDAREYQATSPDSDELRTPYLDAGTLDLSVWARDAIALGLPEKILCREDCAGLCPGCGANLNEADCTCGPPEPDPRFSKLAELRDRL